MSKGSMALVCVQWLARRAIVLVLPLYLTGCRTEGREHAVTTLAGAVEVLRGRVARDTGALAERADARAFLIRAGGAGWEEAFSLLAGVRDTRLEALTVLVGIAEATDDRDQKVAAVDLLIEALEDPEPLIRLLANCCLEGLLTKNPPATLVGLAPGGEGSLDAYKTFILHSKSRAWNCSAEAFWMRKWWSENRESFVFPVEPAAGLRGDLYFEDRFMEGFDPRAP